jgi:hypothetical protein
MLRFLSPGLTQTLAEQANAFSQLTEARLWLRQYGETVVLPVGFVEGSPVEFQDEVKRVVEEADFGSFMGLEFEFTRDPSLAIVRVDFVPGDHSWSSIGNEALRVPIALPTMNLSDLSPGNILHQFAHAAGFLHENVYDPDKQWNLDRLGHAFAGLPHLWNTPQKLHDNFLTVENINQFMNFQSFQNTSLMCPIWPCDYFLTPAIGCGNPLRSTFTSADKRFFTLYYPLGEGVVSRNMIRPLPVSVTPVSSLTVAQETTGEGLSWVWPIVVASIAMVLLATFLILWFI